VPTLRLVSDPGSDDLDVRELRHRLDEFYARTTDYYAFQSPPDNSNWFERMAPLVQEVCDRAARERRKAQILELGAGLPTFPKHFADLKDRFEYHAQDVTPQNRAYLEQLADRVHIGATSRRSPGLTTSSSRPSSSSTSVRRPRSCGR
jgi:hypothetical protein